ncbi:hypothetical protein F4780DRAFT_725525 [Xylariomycetidae sp. FL0641]|nr:hypothetical protein F4780DRAFT_725525 [Xylariomycetidae sp. FL0641]
MKSYLSLFLASVLFQYHGAALQVTPGSSCASMCMDNPESNPLNADSSRTTVGDISCKDSDYDSSKAGIKFKNCLDCLQNSNSTAETESDVSWFLYNIRYSVDVCLYGFPNGAKEISSPCDIDFACQPLKGALQAGNLSSTGDQLEYCTADDGSFNSSQLDACYQCLVSTNDQKYISNFITALKAGCEQQPAPGSLLGLSGTLFTTAHVNITDPPVQQTSGENSSSPMTTGAVVGIAVGAALLFLGGTGLFWVYYRKQRHMNGNKLQSEYDPSGGDASISPPLHGSFPATALKETSVMSDYELRAQKAYTNNTDYYHMLEKEMQSRQPNYAFDPNRPGSGPQSNLPAHPAYLPRAHSRQSSRDRMPQPPKPIKTNTPDSYALQVYLNAAEDANALALPPPPPRPPPAATNGGSSFRGISPTPYGSHSRDSSVSGRGPSPDRRPLINPHIPVRDAPPPPPQAAKVPSLSLPSVPRIRIPKKYNPPKITVQGATPIDGPTGLTHEEGELPIGINISQPIVEHESRFGDSPWERRRKSPPPPLVVEQTAMDRRPKPWVREEAQIRSGRSDFYG